jgi:hypothetical protein
MWLITQEANAGFQDKLFKLYTGESLKQVQSFFAALTVLLFFLRSNEGLTYANLPEQRGKQC